MLAHLVIWLKLMRWPNVLMAGFTLLAIRYGLFEPSIDELGTFRFFSFCMAILLVMAAGYVMNDIVDRNIDGLNKPHKSYIPEPISVVQAKTAVAVLLLLALGFGALTQSLYYVISLTGIALALYYYAAKLKCSVLWGNLLVAIVCALGPALYYLIVPEYLQSHSFDRELLNQYIFFAGLSTLYREQVKDLQDYPGDAQHACKTLPVVKGLSYARWVALASGALLLLLCHVWIWQIMDTLGQLKEALAVLLLVPSGILSVYYLYRGKADDYALSSKLVKALMFGGIILLLI